jgi:hypothetical protein
VHGDQLLTSGHQIHAGGPTATPRCDYWAAHLALWEGRTRAAASDSSPTLHLASRGADDSAGDAVGLLRRVDVALWMAATDSK